MSTRRRGVPPPRSKSPHQMYTLLDELTASATEPMAPADVTNRVALVRENFNELVHGSNPHKANWSLVSMASNVLEVMRELGMIEDAGGLLHDSFLTLKGVGEYALEHNVPPRLAGAEIPVVENMIEAFEQVLSSAPHRNVVRAMRELEKRLRVLKRTDYDANPSKRKKV